MRLRMPVIHLLLPTRPLLMDKKPNDKSANEAKSTSQDAQASILIFISAHAISSLGFAASLLAIWFGWLLPASLTASAPSEISEIKKPRPVLKRHRRSVSSSNRTTPSPISNPTPVRRASAPVELAPILVPHPEENHHDPSRRVYFADSSSVVRRNTMPEPKRQNNFPISAISRPETPPNSSLDDLNPHDSDSSLSKPSRLQKLKRGFNLKPNCRPPVDKQSDRDSIASIESTISERATIKRTNGGFVAAWSNSRLRTAGGDAEPSPSRLSFVRLLSPTTPTTTTTTSSGPADSDIRSPTCLSRKAERRSSTPIPRTYPYGAPYFASPPVLLDKNTAYPSYLKALPQFEDEVQFSSARASERGREPTIRRISLSPTPRAICKRRSASEDWTVRPPNLPI